MTKFANRKKAAAFTLVEIMIVVLIIGILLAIAIPNFISARESSRAKACVANLKQIDSATQQWAMDQKVSATNYATLGPPTLTLVASGPSTTSLVGPDLYIKSEPFCPSGGTYTTATAIDSEPTCSISAGVSSGDYAGPTGTTPAGRYYHGL